MKKTQEKLDHINQQLDELLSKGCNDETLVDRKRELEAKIRSMNKK